MIRSKTCLRCGKVFNVVTPSQERNRKFCSHTCAMKQRHEDVRPVGGYRQACLQCGKEFSVACLCRGKKRKFCSNKCCTNSLRGRKVTWIKPKTVIYGKCQECGKDFAYRSPSEARQKKFCSTECVHKSQQSVKVRIICLQCGKEFCKVPALAKAKFCSRKCKGLYRRKTKIEGMRKCVICHEVKQIECFVSGGKQIKGYICKECGRKMNHIRQRTPHGRFIGSRSIAKTRNLEWSIPETEYCKLINQNCHYCGSKLNETGIGLDRKDNKFGYFIENVVPCCRLCNVTRQDNYTYNEMLLLAEAIKKILMNRGYLRCALPSEESVCVPRYASGDMD